MEDVLVPKEVARYHELVSSLNPCCSGRCSSTLLGLEKMMKADLVLILVVVEDVLVLKHSAMSAVQLESLNPCCSGRCSSTSQQSMELGMKLSLNPCCSGRCSSTVTFHTHINDIVLCLNPCCSGRCSSTHLDAAHGGTAQTVLILVVVEDVLVHLALRQVAMGAAGLNPCCSGRCSSTIVQKMV